MIFWTQNMAVNGIDLWPDHTSKKPNKWDHHCQQLVATVGAMFCTQTFFYIHFKQSIWIENQVSIFTISLAWETSHTLLVVMFTFFTSMQHLGIECNPCPALALICFYAFLLKILLLFLSHYRSSSLKYQSVQVRT